MRNKARCLLYLCNSAGEVDAQAISSVSNSSDGVEGNYHSGPGGYEGGTYSGGYAAEYRSEQGYLDGFEDEEH